MPVRGLLSPSGEWQCDCDPRLPAIWLEVKKNNHNKGRHFYTCQKPEGERCGFFLWDTDAEKREREKFGDSMMATKAGVAESVAPKQVETPVAAPIAVAAAASVPAKEIPPSKQPVPRIYPSLPPPSDAGFEAFDTPTRHKPARPLEEPTYDWEDSDEEQGYKRSIVNPIKRPRFGLHDYEPMEELEMSPPPSPPVRKRPTLGDPFSTPPKQVTSTPHTPPETRPIKLPGSNLSPISLSLIHQLGPHAQTLGGPLWQSLQDHLLRCARVADGAVRGRDAARSIIRKKDIRVDELERRVDESERRVRILEAEREVDRAVIGALKRNVDVLTGKVQRTD